MVVHKSSGNVSQENWALQSVMNGKRRGDTASVVGCCGHASVSSNGRTSVFGTENGGSIPSTEIIDAPVAKLAAAQDLGSCVLWREGSSPNIDAICCVSVIGNAPLPKSGVVMWLDRLVGSSPAHSASMTT